MSHLQDGKVNLSLVQENARKELFTLLEKCGGPKTIVIDESFNGPVGLLAQYHQLVENGVEQVVALMSKPLPRIKSPNIVFISRTHLHLMDLISANIQGLEKNDFRGEYHLIFVPNMSSHCKKHLEHRGVYGNFKNILEFSCYILPMDNDVLSIELNNSFRDYHLDKDPTCLFQTAQALVMLQDLYGPFASIWGKGYAAKTVWDLTKKLTLEGGRVRNVGTSCIDKLILIDRSVDLISPLATQLTYEGLIDEFFGIQTNAVRFPADKFKSADIRTMRGHKESSDITTIILDSSDDLYADIRDKNFNAVGKSLSKKAKSISVQFQERHRDKTVQEIHQFVAKLPNMLANKQALATHTTIAECIKEITDSNEFLDTLQIEQEFLSCIDTDKICPFIEELIALKEPLVKVLRLICLQCATSSGLKPKVLEFYKREIVQVYGIQTLLTIDNLERGGLLHVQSTTRQYMHLRKALYLTMEDTSETDPTDISYVHSVYAPLSVRLTENLCKPRGWKQLQDILGLLPEPTVTDTQPINSFGRRSSMSGDSNQTPKIVLVFFIGGCTYAEISALRFLTQQEDINCEFVVGTTNLINGNSFIRSFMQSDQLINSDN